MCTIKYGCIHSNKNIVIECAAMNNGTMLQVIFFALVLGFILGRLGKKVATVNRFFTQFNAVMMFMIGLILKVAPIGIFCLICRTFANLGITGILPMIKFIGTVYLGLFVQLLVVYMLLLFLFTRLNFLALSTHFRFTVRSPVAAAFSAACEIGSVKSIIFNVISS